MENLTSQYKGIQGKHSGNTLATLCKNTMGFSCKVSILIDHPTRSIIISPPKENYYHALPKEVLITVSTTLVSTLIPLGRLRNFRCFRLRPGWELGKPKPDLNLKVWFCFLNLWNPNLTLKLFNLVLFSFYVYSF